MLRTHERREVEIFLTAPEKAENFAGVLAAVDDAQCLGMPAQSASEIGIKQLARCAEFDALECGEERGGIADDFAAVFEADGKILRVMMDGWLGGGAENGGGVVVCGEFAQDAEAGMEEIDGERLCLVENDDGVGNAMELAAAGSFRGVEGFVKLDGGGDDDRRVPVFGSESGLICFLIW